MLGYTQHAEGEENINHYKQLWEGDASEGERLHVRVQKKKKHKAAAVIWQSIHVNVRPT